MSRWRIGIVSGLWFGLIMGAGSLFISNGTWRSAVTAGAISGIFFGALFALLLPIQMRRAEARAARGEGGFAIQPPEGHEFSFRVPASYKRSQRIAVGGALFAGPTAIIFVPHSVNLPADRSPVVVPANSKSQVTVAPQEMTFLQKLLVPNAPPMVRIVAADRAYDFIVPNWDETAARLRELLGAG